MTEQSSSEPAASGGVSTRAVEIVTACVILLIGAVVVFDSYRLGSQWGDDGPQSGYFPFYVGLLLCVSSGAILVRALMRHVPDDLFVTWGPLRQVMTVLIPAIVYVAAVQVFGIYLASAVYIAVFMAWLGRYSILRSTSIGVAVMAVLFVMFEIWFKVPLVKGLLDPLSFLGY